MHGIEGCAAGWAPSDGSASPRDGRPNIVFLVVESTDGRTWQPGYDASPRPVSVTLTSVARSWELAWVQELACVTELGYVMRV